MLKRARPALVLALVTPCLALVAAGPAAAPKQTVVISTANGKEQIREYKEA